MAQMESLRVHHLTEIESIHLDYVKELEGAERAFEEKIAKIRRAEREYHRGYLQKFVDMKLITY